MALPAPLSPDAWVTHLFSAKAAREGSVVRRKIRDIERYVGREAFEDELRRRGYHAVENSRAVDCLLQSRTRTPDTVADFFEKIGPDFSKSPRSLTPPTLCKSCRCSHQGLH